MANPEVETRTPMGSRMGLSWGAQTTFSTEQNADPPTNFTSYADVTVENGPGGTTFKLGSLVEIAPSIRTADSGSGTAASAPVTVVVVGVGMIQDDESQKNNRNRACIFVRPSATTGSSMIYVGSLRSSQLKLVDPAAAVSSAASLLEDPDALTNSFHSYLGGCKNNKVARPFAWDKIVSLITNHSCKHTKTQNKNKSKKPKATPAAKGSTGKGGKGSTGGKGKGDKGQACRCEGCKKKGGTCTRSKRGGAGGLQTDISVSTLSEMQEDIAAFSGGISTQPGATNQLLQFNLLNNWEQNQTEWLEREKQWLAQITRWTQREAQWVTEADQRATWETKQTAQIGSLCEQAKLAAQREVLLLAEIARLKNENAGYCEDRNAFLQYYMQRDAAWSQALMANPGSNSAARMSAWSCWCGKRKHE